ncbi:hypothetical protein PoB_000973000 [Plakobranchus ocellatus]|uniref:Uncharacterized protein n=1 Tax=Plakobranchus ocellatus TaxID=259542 RepID=A0AAV3YJG1_9GAST|nr:hypothetical protein PoB_000973000 [Plakobranchus ocellatus]
MYTAWPDLTQSGISGSTPIGQGHQTGPGKSGEDADDKPPNIMQRLKGHLNTFVIIARLGSLVRSLSALNVTLAVGLL